MKSNKSISRKNVYFFRADFLQGVNGVLNGDPSDEQEHVYARTQKASWQEALKIGQTALNNGSNLKKFAHIKLAEIRDPKESVCLVALKTLKGMSKVIKVDNVLAEHIEIMVKKPKCPFCTKFFTTKQSFTEHYQSQHEDRSHECKQCQKTFSGTKNYFNKHKRLCQKLIKCQCGNTFHTDSGFSKHQAGTAECKKAKKTIIPDPEYEHEEMVSISVAELNDLHAQIKMLEEENKKNVCTSCKKKSNAKKANH